MSEQTGGWVGSLDFTPVELTIIWAHLYLAANAMNASVRDKIEQFLAANGVPLAELHEVANQAAAFAEMSANQPTEPPAA